MSEHRETREIDKWLKWAAVMGPIFGFIFGLCGGAIGAYQAFKDDTHRIQLIEGWKDKQEDFNKATIEAIATLKEVVKHIK